MTQDPRIEWFKRDRAGARWDAIYNAEATEPDERYFQLRRDYAVDFALTAAGRDGRILDLGCGAGAATGSLIELGCRVTALDYSPDMLAFAQSRLRELGHDHPPLARGDSNVLPFPDATFDCVVCLGVISYQDDYGPTLREIRRVLVPGGTALITCRNVLRWVASDPWLMIKAVGRLLLRGRRPRQSGIGRHLDPAEVMRELRTAGFQIERFEGIGLGPYKVAGRPLFSPRFSMVLSERLTPVLRRLGLGAVVNWTADVSMFLVRSRQAS